MNAKKDSTATGGGASRDEQRRRFLEAAAAMVRAAKDLDPTVTGGYVAYRIELGDLADGMPNYVGLERRARV